MMDPNPIPPPSSAVASAKEGPVQPQTAVPPAPPIPPIPAKSKNWLIISFVTLVILLSLGAAGFFAYRYVQLKQQTSQAKPTPSSTPNPTASWKTYTDKTYAFEFKYPNEYTASNETVNGIVNDSRVDFETDAATYLTLIRKNPIPYDEKYFCSANTKVYPCIYTEGWGQDTPVKDISLGGKKAISFYMTPSAGPDSAYHVIVTKEAPYIELRMFVAGGGLDNTFTQILSTFKFTEGETIHPFTPPPTGCNAPPGMSCL